MSMLIFNLTTFGKPYLLKSIQAKDIKTELYSTLQEGVDGRVQMLENVFIKHAGIIIHPMFIEECEKWAIAERMFLSKDSKVYVNENGSNECGVNMATIIRNPKYQIGGCPHLFGEILVCISEINYKKICDKPMEYWADMKEEEDEDEEEEDCCGICLHDSICDTCGKDKEHADYNLACKCCGCCDGEHVEGFEYQCE